MTSDAYELVALTMRYVFAGLMLLIALRAGKGALTDSRRAAKLRRLSPMTGLSGELVVLEGDQRARRGMRYPVIREGMIGCSRRADIRIRHSTVRRRHAYFQLSEDGLHVRTHAGARLRDGAGGMAKELVLADGDSLYVGSVKLLLVLSVPDAPRRRVHPERDEAQDAAEDVLFHDGDWNEDFPEAGEADGEMTGRDVEGRGGMSDSDVRYRRPEAGVYSDAERRGGMRDSDARYRRPEADVGSEAERRGATRASDERCRRPEAGAGNEAEGRGVTHDSDARYRRPEADAYSEAERYGATRDSDERCRRPEADVYSDAERRGVTRDSDAKYRRPEAGAYSDGSRWEATSDPGFDSDSGASSEEEFPWYDSLTDMRKPAKERGAFPEGDDPFDVFLDEQDEDEF